MEYNLKSLINYTITYEIQYNLILSIISLAI